MRNFESFVQQYNQLLHSLWSIRFPYFRKSICLPPIFQRINHFSIELLYFISISSLGFLILSSLNPKSVEFRPRNLDTFFTSVSAATVSSMSTVEMEVFSNSQLLVMTLLMFVGGEVFTSMVGLHIKGHKLCKPTRTGAKISSVSHENFHSTRSFPDQFELEVVSVSRKDTSSSLESLDYHLRTGSIKFLAYVVLGYLLLFHFLGVSFVFGYISLISSAKIVISKKRLNRFSFAIFTVVSTFASCGFLPTNENMIVFGKNSGLLLILIPQVLFGNTLFPSCLRFCLWFLGKFFKSLHSQYLLSNSEQIGYFHLLPGLHSWMLVSTVFGFILIQFILFCSLEWNSLGLSGMSIYQKIIGVLFQVTNARHTGESIVDISIISQAILVLFVVMMYLPPYTAFLRVKGGDKITEYKTRTVRVLDSLIFSQLSYLAIFIIVICITERKSLKEDPLNFNVLNIVVEVISAYGNVGFSTGYSCGRQIKPDPSCQDKYVGFVGKWSDEGKIVLIIVMFIGRLKKFNMHGGKAWKLI